MLKRKEPKLIPISNMPPGCVSSISNTLSLKIGRLGVHYH